MNGVLSLERPVEMGCFAFIPPESRLISRRFALALHFKWTVERQEGRTFICAAFKNCVLFPDFKILWVFSIV